MGLILKVLSPNLPRSILNEASYATMHSHLQHLHDELQAAISDMSHEDQLRRPDGKWCAAEILEHLYLTYTGTSKAFQKCLSAGKPLAKKPSMKNRVATLLIVRMGRVPRGREAPKGTVPRGTATDTVVAGIFPAIAKMDEAIRRCEAAYGSSVNLLDHPVLGPLSASDWRKFHLVHGRHHIKQILQLRNSRTRAAAQPA
jgi:hypothetical protein